MYIFYYNWQVSKHFGNSTSFDYFLKHFLLLHLAKTGKNRQTIETKYKVVTKGNMEKNQKYGNEGATC